MRLPIAAVLLAATIAVPLQAQRQRRGYSAIQPDALRGMLFTIAHDSMGGRDTGARGNALTAEWVAAEFRRAGLEPAGENGGWFQAIPFIAVQADRASGLTAGGAALRVGADIVPVGPAVPWPASLTQAVYGGTLADSASWPDAASVAGRLVVFSAPEGADLRATFGGFGRVMAQARFGGAAGYAVAALDAVPSDLVDQILQPRFTTDTTIPGGKPVLLVSRAAAAALVGAAGATGEGAGPNLSGEVRYTREPLRYPARNVIGVLRGSDPSLAETYVSLSAHNDHVGLTRAPVDHDSAFAYNRVIRPLGADSPDRTPTGAEAARIRAVRDSLAARRPSRPDSVFNGADDDGSGTVALVAIARSLATGPRPRRSILFVSHAAEERGLLGSRWFTDNPTVPRDSIIAEIDEDMIGRGTAADLPDGGPGYLEVIGSRRVSREFGDTLEAVNARQPVPFVFNYEFDAPGHPLQYYCRADHYSYARYGIPAVALSRGEHADYHQVTDEPQYISYPDLARVATLVRDAAVAIGNMDHRPALNGPRGDPRAPCRQ